MPMATPTSLQARYTGSASPVSRNSRGVAPWLLITEPMAL
jgi:hypothetical protein